MVLVATIGVSQVLLLLQTLVPRVKESTTYPVPIHKQVELGGTVITGAGLLVIAVVPAVLIGLTYFMTKTPYGLVIQATAENRDAPGSRRCASSVWVRAYGRCPEPWPSLRACSTCRSRA